MRKLILIGPIGCGKTTLTQALMGEEIEYKKTQAIDVVSNEIIDTPGEYLEMTRMRGALMTTSADAEVIVLLQSAVEERLMYSPSYGGAFAKEIVGVVTQIDIANKSQIARAEAALKLAGAEKIFKVSSYTGEGIEELKNYLT